jgi:hypothetical protein
MVPPLIHEIRGVSVAAIAKIGADASAGKRLKTITSI